MNDIKMKSIYRPNGRLAYTIRDYHEDLLPKPVRHLVKSNFVDFNITQVIDIQHQAEIIHIVKLQDQKVLNNCRVGNGGMKVVEEHKRG